MASRRSPYGFLATLVKVASARIFILALAALAMLWVAGCGGGDSSTTATTASSSGKAESAPSSADGRAGSEKSEKSGEGLPEGNQAERGQATGKGDVAAQSPSAGKQGPKVKMPTGERAPTISPEMQRQATTADILLASPAFRPSAGLPASFTCDGDNTSPPLRWDGVPSSAEELVLFALNLRPVEEHLFFDWAVAGLDPSLRSLEAGRLPPGAVVGRNGFGRTGYSICPPAGSAESYIFMLYAIPEAMHPKAGFDPLSLRETVVKQAGNVGLLGASYERQ